MTGSYFFVSDLSFENISQKCYHAKTDDNNNAYMAGLNYWGRGKLLWVRWVHGLGPLYSPGVRPSLSLHCHLMNVARCPWSICRQTKYFFIFCSFFMDAMGTESNHEASHTLDFIKWSNHCPSTDCLSAPWAGSLKLHFPHIFSYPLRVTSIFIIPLDSWIFVPTFSLTLETFSRWIWAQIFCSSADTDWRRLQGFNESVNPASLYIVHV